MNLAEVVIFVQLLNLLIILQQFLYHLNKKKMRPNGSNQNYGYNNTPNYFMHRNRLLSINTPKLSPLRILQSPFPNMQPNYFESQVPMGADFHLEQVQPNQEDVEVNESDDESYSQLQFQKFPQNQEVSKDNMIDFLVATINIEQDRIQRVKQHMQNSGQTFLSQVFQYLHKRFKKTKKTKEEMIKYTMRKSFKFITDQMKKQDPTLIPILSTDGIQGMSIYFNKYTDNKEISIPFKKNSAEKTMNTAFLKNVFSVEQFARDYRRFLKTFQSQFLKDNKKKVNSMTEAVKTCINSKNYKSLQNYKRIPWTNSILAKLRAFAADLLNFSPHKGLPSPSAQRITIPHSENQNPNPTSQQQKPQRKQSFQLSAEYYNKEQDYRQSHKLENNDDHFREFMNQDDADENDDYIHQLTYQQKKVKKKSVIILTPPMMPLSDPFKFDHQPLE